MRALISLVLLGSLAVAGKLERAIPWNDQAERSLLGAVLLENHALSYIGQLKAEEFFADAHRTLFETCLELHAKRCPIDLVTVTEALSNAHKLKSVGGAAYVAALVDGVPRVANVEHYVGIIREKAARRRLIRIAETAIERAFDESEEVEVALDLVGADVADLSFSVAGKHTVMSYQQASAEKLKSFSQPQGPRIFTGVEKLDSLTGGFMGGELVVITALTGAGKSLFGAQTRAKACLDGFHGLYCSGEMFAPHIAGRELATVAGVSHRKMRMPERYSQEEVRALIGAAEGMCQKCCIMDGELTIEAIRREARRVKRSNGLGLVILDYDELIDAPGKNEIEQQKVLARESKRLGIELNCPVFLISQLRKSLTPDEAKRPSLDRIYGSGMKVKHASFVLFVHREFVRNLEGDETEAQIFVLKSRDTRAGKISAKYNVRTLRFEDAPEIGEGERKQKKSRKGKEAASEPESEERLFQESVEEEQ